jgi:Asp-tRNA(Asn)/Glu-tRNA(Gln) amidotransferase A subunit family amidase
MQDEMKNYPTNDILYKLIRSGTKGAIGLPLNVQVIGKPWHEEMVLKRNNLLKKNKKSPIKT